MQKYFLSSLRISIIMLFTCSLLYFLIVFLFGKLTPGSGNGEKLMSKGRVVGYEKIGQQFTQDKYFWGRPSAVAYNAAGSGGSNKAASNTEYLKTVSDRIDTFLVHNPEVRRKDIPAELVTASGSGLDPHISPEAALLQVARVAKARNTSKETVRALVTRSIQHNPIGPDVVHVLKLNIALDAIK